MAGSGGQPPKGVTGLSAKMGRSSMGVTGLPGGVPDGDVTGKGDKGEVGQKKWRGGWDSVEVRAVGPEFSRRALTLKELRESSSDESGRVIFGIVIFSFKLGRLTLERNMVMLLRNLLL